MIDFTFSDLLSDMHVHTHHTPGGMSTIRENLALARRKGLSYLSIVNHISECHVQDFKNMAKIHTDAGVDIISGINIDVMKVDDNFQSIIAAVKPKFITLSINPELGEKMVSAERFIELIDDAINFYGVTYMCDITKSCASHIPTAEHRRFSSLFAALCIKRMLTIEIPCGNKSDEEMFMLTKILEDCEDKKVSYAFGSGAFYCETIGGMEEAVLLAENFNMKKERVLNCDKDALNRLSNNYEPSIGVHDHNSARG